MKHAASRAALTRHFRKIHKEGQGVWKIEVFDCINLPEFLLNLLVSGRPPARGLPMAVFKTAAAMAAGEHTCDCLLCGLTIGHDVTPRDIAVMHAFRDDPYEGVVFCICNGCHDDNQEALSGRVLAYLKTNLISDLRRLPPMASGGRAAQ